MMLQRGVLAGAAFLLIAFAVTVVAQAPSGTRKAWALAIHAGAGTMPKDIPEAEKQAYLQDLAEALGQGRMALHGGAKAIDVVENVVRILEDMPRFNAGKGAVFTHEGKNELDAAIMDGSNLACGAVAGVGTVKNPVQLARAVMDRSPHVLLVGKGAEEFAASIGLERMDPSYFRTEFRWQQLQEALAKEKAVAAAAPGGGLSTKAEKFGTVGAVALDRHGNLAAATSTGGMTNKRWGRVGDVPIIGAGTYANNATVAVSCTGWGEKFIRHSVAHTLSSLVELKGLSVQDAAKEMIERRLEPGDGGLIAVGRDGSIALAFNTPGMYRGATDAHGLFEVGIWESTQRP
jgi:beta-aspartyl-peptidase (threonine type)